MKRIYILIVNWNGWQDTIECLESVFRLDYPDFRVIVCDNGSTDDSFERIIAWAEGRLTVDAHFQKSSLQYLTSPPVAKPIPYRVYDRKHAEQGGDLSDSSGLVLIHTDENLGFAGGNNVGLKFAIARNDFDGVWLLNNDTVVDSISLNALVQGISNKPSAGMCGSTLAHYENPERIQARGGGWYCKWIGLPWHIGQLEKNSTPARVRHVECWMNYIVGASMLVSWAFLNDVGLLCEDYFLYFEELDWALRGKERFTLAYAPESLVYHKIGRSIGTRSDPRRKSATCDYYAIRNRLMFTRRFFPEALPTVYLSVCMAMCVRVLTGQWDRVRMIWKLLNNTNGKEPGIESHGKN